jgi:hypothetical protein
LGVPAPSKRRPIISGWDDGGRGRRGCCLCSGGIYSDQELAIFPLSPFFFLFSIRRYLKKEEAMDVESGVPGAGSPFVNRIMAPGDVVLDLTKASNVLRLGSGLRQDGDNIAMTKVGRLQFKKPNKYWVEGSQKRVSCLLSIL